MYQLKIREVKLPLVYVAESREDCRMAEEAGLSYIYKSNGLTDRKIVCLVMLPILKKMFPYIDWYKQLGIKRYENIIVHVLGNSEKNPAVAHSGSAKGGANRIVDIAMEDRWFSGGDDKPCYVERKLEDLMGCSNASVNIEVLQDLYLLPSFMDDIAAAVAKNYYGSKAWNEGYDKKRGACLGNYDQDYEARNLIILDISGSIPDGISATMLTLIGTLRERCNADLIITGSKSYYWKAGEELPDPDIIRSMIGYANECTMFYKILREHIVGKHWGNVIAFGDYDRPYPRYNEHAEEIPSTTVDKVWCYHTCYDDWAGYANWVNEITDCQDVEFNTSWCNVIQDKKVS